MKVVMTLSNPLVYDMRVKLEAAALAEAGHDVTVLAWDRKGTYPREEKMDGFIVRRIRNSTFMRTLPFDLLRLHPLWGVMFREALSLAPDIIHCHDLDTAPVGLRMSKKASIKFIYDAHEVWPRMIGRDIPYIVPAYFRQLDRKCLRHAHGLIITIEDNIDYYRSLGYEGDITIIQNFRPIYSENYVPPDNDVFTLGYIGVLTRPRFLIQVINVVSDMKDVKLEIYGSGPLRDKVKVACEKTSNCHYHNPIPPEKVLETTAGFDAVLHMIDPSDMNNKISSSNKQYEAMSTGRPIITTVGTNAGKLASDTHSGIVVGFDRESLREGILLLRDDRKLREKLGRAGLKAARERYNWDAQKKKLIALYENMN